MKFSNFAEFKTSAALSLQQVALYLSKELASCVRELRNGLSKLDLNNNFESFEWTGTIAASSEQAIRNQFRDGIIPTKRLIVRATGNGVVDGDTEWTVDYVYLKNTVASAVTVTVIFLK